MEFCISGLAELAALQKQIETKSQVQTVLKHFKVVCRPYNVLAKPLALEKTTVFVAQTWFDKRS